MVGRLSEKCIADAQFLSALVRFGSLADIPPTNPDVRFTPESGHVQRN